MSYNRAAAPAIVTCEMKRFLRALAIAACMAASVSAQTNEGVTFRRGNQELGFWGGYSPSSMLGIGEARDRKFFELNAQYARTLVAGQHVALKWVFELVPVALLNDPNEWYFNNSHQQTGYRAGATTYGGGVTPLGLQLNLLNGHRVQPFFDGHGGMLCFTRQEPVPHSTQANFTFNFGTGVQVFTGKRSSLLLGYKYHHISNDNTANQNPGVDNSEFYAGVLWQWRGWKR